METQGNFQLFLTEHTLNFFKDIFKLLQANDLFSLNFICVIRDQKALEYLDLDGERYAVVGTVLILLKMVSEYCK